MSKRKATSYYHNDSLLEVGKKYHGCKFSQVPAWYFLWLYEQGAFSDLYLREWIELNMEVLKEEKGNGSPTEQADYDKYERQRIMRKNLRSKPLTTRPGDII